MMILMGCRHCTTTSHKLLQTRRTFLANVVLWTGILLAGVTGMPLLCAAPIPRPLIKQSAYGRPNMVLFLVEGLTFEDLPPYGATNRLMPRWKQLADEGLRLDAAYGAGPQPEVALRQWLGDVEQTAILLSETGRVLSTASTAPLPKRLMEQGYVTGTLGWWPPGEAWPPMAQGLEEWFGAFDRNEAQQVYPRYLYRNERRYEFNPPSTPNPTAAPQLLQTAITNFIRTSKLYPFYLQIIRPSPESETNRQEWLAQLDRELGAVLDSLRLHGVATQTLVVAGGLASWRAPKMPTRSIAGPMGRLRCSTNGVYEGDLRIPLLMRWPAKLTAGTTNALPVTLPQLHATLALWGDVPLTPELRGLCRGEQFTNRNPTNLPLRAIWHISSTGAEALRDGPWKLLRPAPNAPFELYHLENDPHELENLAVQQPERVKKLSALLQNWRRAMAPTR